MARIKRRSYFALQNSSNFNEAKSFKKLLVKQMFIQKR